MGKSNKNTQAPTLQIMSSFKQDNLTVKLTKLSLATAFLLGLLVGTTQVVLDYLNQEEQLNDNIDNILKAAENSAKEAAYNLNENVAAIVIDGLMQYSFIDNAVIKNSFGGILASGTQVPDIGSFSRSISNYLFDIDKEYTIDLPGDDRDPVYGQLSIIVDQHKAMGNLYERSLFTLLSGLLKNLVLGALLATVFYIVLTRPIVKVAEEVSKKYTAKDEKQEVAIPAELADNEIGALLTVFNQFVLGVKDADSFLITVLNSSPIAMTISTISDGVILYANPVTQTMLGRTEAELVGRKMKEFYLNMDDRELLFGISEENVGINTNEPLEKQELLVERKDGTMIYIDSNIQAIEYEGKAVLISTFFDLTDRKEMDKKLRHSQRMEAVGQLTGGVAHDFNNLLGIMLGNADLLSQKADNEGVKKRIDAIKKAISRASSLTKRLLSFSRQLPLAPTPTDLQKLLNNLMDMLRRTLGETVNLEIEETPKMNHALVDPHQLDNALINLALNARDSMPDGGQLTIRASDVTFGEAYSKQHQDMTPGDYVKIQVSDTGNGMSPEIIDRVFEPFFTTKDIGQGSGLGLSMVYGFVKQSKGHITVESTEGEGTTISLYFPSVNQQPERKKPPKKDAVIENITILLVEDDPGLRETTSSILNNIGYDVIEAADGQAALDILSIRAEEIDLIFSDVVMPNNMSGLDLAKQVMDKYHNIKILLTSGYPDKAADQAKIEKLGIDMIAKPYEREQLISAIERVSG